MVSPLDYACQIIEAAGHEKVFRPGLKRSGGQLRGPHTCGVSDKSDALSVNLSVPLGKWQCFACGATGNALTYPEGGSAGKGAAFIEAVNRLADRIDAEHYRSSASHTKRAQPVKPVTQSKPSKPVADPAALSKWWCHLPGVWDTPAATYLRDRKLWPEDEDKWERWQIRVSKVTRWADRAALNRLADIPNVPLRYRPNELVGAVVYVEHGPAPGSGEWFPAICGFHLDGLNSDGQRLKDWKVAAGKRGTTTVALTSDLTLPCIVTEGITDMLAVLALRSIGEVLKVAQKPIPVPCEKPLGAGEVRSVNSAGRFNLRNIDTPLPIVIAPDRDKTGREHANRCELEGLGEGREVRMWRWWQDSDADDLADALTEWWPELVAA